jgi:LCP family protein required for cell wall assembly
MMLMVIAGGVYAYQQVFGAINKIGSAQEVRVQPTPASSGPPPALLQRPFNVLVIGVDVRQDDSQGVRSDTVIVAHVDPVERWASMLSIPRDTVVDIPSDSCATQKINAAYACGYNHPGVYDDVEDPRDSGAALVADTVEDYLDITIDYTMQVDFNGFQRLVDAIGGVTIDVPRAILDAEYPTEDNGYMRLYYPAGLQRMDGAQALRYARTRHVDNDFGRAQRQQQVLQAGLDKLKQQNLQDQIKAAPQLLDVVSDSVRTTMPINNVSTLQGLATLAQELSSDRIKRLVLQPETKPDGSSTLIDNDYINVRWDQAYLRRMVWEWQTPPGQASIALDKAAVVQVQNGGAERRLVSQVTAELEERGFEMAPAEDAPTRNMSRTVILNYTGNDETARELAQALDIDEQRIRDESDEPAPSNVDIVVRLGEDYQPDVDAGTTTDE